MMEYGKDDYPFRPGSHLFTENQLVSLNLTSASWASLNLNNP